MHARVLSCTFRSLFRSSEPTFPLHEQKTRHKPEFFVMISLARIGKAFSWAIGRREEGRLVWERLIKKSKVEKGPEDCTLY